MHNALLTLVRNYNQRRTISYFYSYMSTYNFSTENFYV